jgi:two-component system sensor histidine kinase KdpD
MRRPTAYLSAIAGVIAVTALGLAAFDYLTVADVAMLYVVAIMLPSRAGRGPALVAATLAVLALDIFFVPPRFHIKVENPRYLVTFAVMFAAGVAFAALSVRLRRREAQVRDAELRARTEELRSSLLAAVSHDLRTPLAVITGAATSLRDDAAAVTPAARTELLETIVGEAHRLERVLANLLAATRVETGLQPNREWVTVEELVGSALGRLERTLGDREVVVDVPSELLVSVDPVLFEQVLINLIENAAKHGVPPIEVRAANVGGALEIDVADRGPGVPAADRARVFEKFARVDGTRAAGVGLGLAVCRGIVAAHGGTIAALDGARFRVVLPQTEPPP